MSSNRYADSRF